MDGYTPNPGRTVTLTLPESQVLEAEALGVDLSQLCTGLLSVELPKLRRGRQWAEENKAAIESWNVWVEKNGLPLGPHRLV